MSYYAIGFGGTGAKCIEALLHLCAAGLTPDDKLYILFVDQDSSNGNLNAAQQLLQAYKKCQLNREGVEDFLRTPVTSAKSDNWMPESNRETTLEDFISYPNLTDEYRSLFDVLYTEQERTTKLGKGFRGHPSIGATVFAASADLNDEDPWKEIKTKMLDDANGDKHSRVMFFGSIFGGTGASGVPTISRLFKDWTTDFDENPFKLGGVLMLPFFTFNPLNGNELHADSRDFLLNTQGALQYYHQHDYMEIFDKAYILGCNDLRNMGKAEIGDKNQKNPPHWVEFFAALAAIDFFSQKDFPDERYNLIARQASKELYWTDLPFDSTTARKKLTNLLRFAFAYCSVYLPAVKVLKDQKDPYWAPWYIDFFKRKKINDIQNKLDNELGAVEDYCRRFLEWFAAIEYSITGNPGTKYLVDYSSFATLNPDKDGKLEIKLKEKFDLNRFGDFKISDKEKKIDLKTIWTYMCESYSDGTAENGSWKFINQLYHHCGK